MSTPHFYIVDVFAEQKYTGNPLAVVMNAATLSSTDMQHIAREINYSETIFILHSEPVANGGYEMRIFTPESELPFAGHPCLGAAYIIECYLLKQKTEVLLLNLPAGQISVYLHYGDATLGLIDRLWMRQRLPVFGQTFQREQLAEVLGLEPVAIDARFPIQEVSTGLPFIIVPLHNLETVQQARILRKAYFNLVNKTQAKAILIFAPQTYHAQHDLNVRVFADYYGISEDPATGSANGALAAYLFKYQYVSDDHLFLQVEQGYEIRRPSLLLLNARNIDGHLDIAIGGKVIEVAQGELL